MAVKFNPKSANTMESRIEWNAEEEIQLFKALGGLKPIGINKHFYMACICERLSVALKREINPDVVWAHLRTMYNLDILDQMEPLPFPQDQLDFSLPEAEFSTLMLKKLQDVEEKRLLDEKEKINDASPVPTVKSRTSTPQPQTSSNKSLSTNNVRPSSSTAQGGTQTSSKSTAANGPSNSSGTPSSNASVSASHTPSNHTNNNNNNSNNNNNATGHGNNVSGTSSSTGSGSGGIGNAALTAVKSSNSLAQKEFEKKIAVKLASIETPKRTPKRTRGSMSVESNSPSTTPPPTQTKRRRI